MAEAAIVQGAAEKISDTVFEAIGHQLGYLINYKSNIEKLRNQYNQLNAARERVQREVKEAKDNGKKIFNGVQDWLTRIEKIIAEVEKFLDKCKAKRWGTSRYQLSKKATKTAQVIVDEIQNVDKFNLFAYRPRVLTTVSSKSFTPLESRKSTLKEIMEVLRDPNINMIGVYGLSGVGKTALVQEVIIKAKVEKLFDSIIMVNVKENQGPEKIQGEMAEMLSLKFDEETVTVRARRLYARMADEEKILVILDDLRAKLDLENVGVPSGDACKGCKILLTSRTRDVLSVEMGTKKRVEVLPLSPEEAWSLFEKVVDDVRGNPDLQSVATEVVKRCAGLPVIIVAVANALKGKTLPVWKDTLKNLEKNIDDNEQKEVKDIYAALKSSYNNLKDEVKSMFLLFGLLPKDDIAIGWLFQYAMGLGLLGDLTFEDARNKVHRLIDDLKGQCLLLDGESNREQVKMHDLVHDFAVSLASRDRHACTKDWPEKHMREKCTMISLPSNKIQQLSERLECPKLELISLGKMDGHEKIPETFLMVKADGHAHEEIPETFFEEMKNLKVMALSMMHLMSLPSLQFLKKLKMLCLDCCVLGDIAIIGELKGLEILRLTECDLVELPKEIGQLTCLKLLDLSNNPKLEVIPADVMSSLKHLEELYLANSFAQWEVEELNSERSNASLSDFKHLSKLTTLKVDIPDAKTFPKDLLLEKLERYLILIGKWSESNKGMDGTKRTLKLKSNSIPQLEDGIKILLNKADSLYLAELNGIKGIMDELEKEGYKQLKELHVQNNDEIECIINSREQAPGKTFPVLESIFLGSLSNLEKIFHGQLSDGSFRNLSIVKVQHCYRLKYLLSLSVVPGGFVQLKELEIKECKIMGAIFSEEGKDQKDNALDVTEFLELRSLKMQSLPKLMGFCFHVISPSTQKSNPLFNRKVSFPKLEDLTLSYINLEKIWDQNLPASSASFQNLRRLTIWKCGNLKYLISSSNAKSLVQLNYLEIEGCQAMEEVVKMEEGMLIEMFPKLEILQLKNLPNLSRFCTGSLIKFPLKVLQILNCREMKTFISKSSSNDIEPLFNESVAFPNLETISIAKMDNLEMVWHNQLTEDSFYNLRNMTVRNCVKLQKIFPHNLLRRFQNLETLEVRLCNSLEEVFTKPGKKLEEKPTGVDFKLGSLHLHSLRKLKHIWNGNFSESHTFKNLSSIKVEGCLSLEYLIPASMATGGSKKEGRREIVFPKVTNLYLRKLPELKSVYSKIFASKWPSLIKMEVHECDKLRIFASDIPSFQEQVHCDGGVKNPNEQTLFFVEKDTFPELKELTLTKNGAMKEIWHAQVQAEFFPKLKVLKLICLPKLMHMCNEDSEEGVVFQHLETLEISECVKLKMLVPSSITFHSLTTLQVSKCHGLVNLVTSSASRSLVQLTKLIVRECNNIGEIIADDGGGAGEAIAFNQLTNLALISLPNLTTFYSGRYSFKFTLLPFVHQCPKMNTDDKSRLLSTQMTPSKTLSQSQQFIDNEEKEEESSKEETPKSSTPSSANESVKPTSPAKKSEASTFVATTPETTDSNALSSEIEAFYASVGEKSESCQCQPTSRDGIAHAQCNKPKPDQADIDNALELVNNVLATHFSSACDLGCSSSFKSALELLCVLDEHDGISVRMKSLVLQLSNDFELMTQRFDWANEMIERRNKLIQSKADTEFQLNENKEKFLKLSLVKSNIGIGISEVDGQIKALQQQINSLTEQRNLAEQEKIANFEDGKKLKDKLNEDVKKAGNAEKEKEIAERAKDELEEKWSGFTKEFLYIQNRI